MQLTRVHGDGEIDFIAVSLKLQTYTRSMNLGKRIADEL